MGVLIVSSFTELLGVNCLKTLWRENTTARLMPGECPAPATPAPALHSHVARPAASGSTAPAMPSLIKTDAFSPRDFQDDSLKKKKNL